MSELRPPTKQQLCELQEYLEYHRLRWQRDVFQRLIAQRDTLLARVAELEAVSRLVEAVSKYLREGHGGDGVGLTSNGLSLDKVIETLPEEAKGKP